MSEIRTIFRGILSPCAICRIPDLPAVEDERWNQNAPFYAGSSSRISARLLDGVYVLSMWVSLPLALWLISGGMGVLIDVRTSCIMRSGWKRKPREARPKLLNQFFEVSR
jgi:hypothetical protein